MSTSTTPSQTTMLTTLRKRTAPFLPPPLLRIIHAVDTYAYLHRASIADSTGVTIDEPSMTLLSSLLVAYLIWRFIKGIAFLFSNKRSTAHLGEESVLGLIGDNVLGNHRAAGNAIPFEDTVLICGAMGSGKTTLLHRLLCQNEREPPMTVTSLVANAIYLPKNNTNHDGIVRIIDYPGHPSLASLFTQLLLPTTTSRVIFTIDTTQPVTEAVSLLYSSILINSPVRKSWKDQQLDILVTCTKTDLKGSKNYKRIKIQLRNELERLRKVDSVVSHPNGEDWTLNGKNIDLDNLGEDVPIRLYFVEVGLGSEEDSGMAIVRDFVLNGLVPR